ncbi:hypothetical protein [Microbacterium rhizophilus]|uniref:hypothetical protein n=1 Tax=Microbacterium rhizophilus TaxID=3138934 RepID=UPI0031E9CD27
MESGPFIETVRARIVRAGRWQYVEMLDAWDDLIGQEDDEPDLVADAAGEDWNPPGRVVEFSHRPLVDGNLQAMRQKTPVEAWSAEGWTVMRWSASVPVGLPPGARDTPIVTFHSLSERGVGERGWIGVETCGGNYYAVDCSPADERVTTWPPAEFEADARRLALVLLDENRARGSAVAALTADPELVVAVESVREVLAQDRTMRERAQGLATLFGVPADTVARALDGEPIPDAKHYEPRGILGTIWESARADGASIRRPGQSAGALTRAESRLADLQRREAGSFVHSPGWATASVIAGPILIALVWIRWDAPITWVVTVIAGLGMVVGVHDLWRHGRRKREQRRSS